VAAKIRTRQIGASRWYVNPETDVKVPGVTSVISMLPKPFLTFWAAKMTAEAAVDNLPAVTSIAERDPSGAVDYLKGAHRRYTKLRAGVGSDAHDLFERLIRGEYVGRVHPDMEPYRRHFLEFLDAVQPELVRAEDIAWSDTHAYAGSFDAILRVRLGEDGKPDQRGESVQLMCDWKTSKDTYPEVALQMSAYAYADRLIDAEGNSEPMPSFDGGAVLHITDEDWAFKPVRVDRDVHSYFLDLRRIFDWDRDVSKTVLGRAIAKGADRLVTGTQRRK
jgi:hypothetical protein